MVRVPDVVRARAAVGGDGGAAWVAALPGVLAGLQERWSIRVGEQVGGGTASVVLRARTAAGDPVVVKVAVPDAGLADQVRALQLADGQGCVRVLASDPARCAVLLEALGPPVHAVGLPPEAQLHALTAVLAQVRRTPAAQGGAGWPGEAVDRASALHELVSRLWRELDRPCPERVVARALGCAEQHAGAFDPAGAVLVHGDPAPDNLLAVPHHRPGAEAGFVLVDPEPFLGDPSYDLGVALRDWCPQLLAGDSAHAAAVARRYCSLLASGSGLDEAAIWEWGYLERVCTGLYALSLGAADLARPFLVTAEALRGAGPDP